jgi:hypothetical protein
MQPGSSARCVCRAGYADLWHLDWFLSCLLPVLCRYFDFNSPWSELDR